MKTQTDHLDHEGHCFEFSFPRLDTLVQVEETEDEVVVRATRDSFSERRKIGFIRELAAEGFISEVYQSFSGFGGWSSLPVRWLVDRSWLKLDKAVRIRTNRIMIRLIAGAIGLLLVMMSVVFISTF